MHQVCKNPEKTKQRKNGLPSEQWISTQLPRLHKEASALSDDESVPKSVVPLHRGSNPPIPASINAHRPPAFKPPKPRTPHLSKGKTRLGDEYDGPVLQRGPIALPSRSLEEEYDSPSIGVIRVSRSVEDEAPSGPSKRVLHEYVTPPAKRPKLLGNGSMGFGAPGRRISSAIRFKPPLKASTSLQHPPVSTLSTSTTEVRGMSPPRESNDWSDGSELQLNAVFRNLNAEDGTVNNGLAVANRGNGGGDPAEALSSSDVDDGNHSFPAYRMY